MSLPFKQRREEIRGPLCCNCSARRGFGLGPGSRALLESGIGPRPRPSTWGVGRDGASDRRLHGLWSFWAHPVGDLEVFNPPWKSWSHAGWWGGKGSPGKVGESLGKLGGKLERCLWGQLTVFCHGTGCWKPSYVPCHHAWLSSARSATLCLATLNH